MKTTHRLSVAACLSLVLYLNTHAQNTPVTCYPVGSVNCTGDDNGVVMRYAECCSQPRAADIYYKTNESDEQCRICGPVFVEEESYPSFVTTSVLIIEWTLHPNSINVSRYQSIYYEKGDPSPEQAVPLTFDPPATSQQFLALTVGTEYVFVVTARGENGGLSELSLTWEAGKSHLPTFSNFAIIESTPSSVQTEWLLRCNGVFPLQQMTVRWRNGTTDNDVFPSENVATFQYAENSSLSDGTLLGFLFENLRPATVYVVQIEGINRLGTSTSHFIIQTGEVPSQGGALLPGNGGTSSLISSTKTFVLMLCIQMISLYTLNTPP